MILYIFNLPFLANLAILVVAGYYFCTFLNKWGYFTSAKYGILLNTTFAVVFYSSSLGKDTGIHLLLLVLTAIPLVLFDFEGLFNVIVGASIPLIGLLILELTNYSLGYHFKISSQYASSMYIVSWVLITLINFLYIRFYFKAYRDAEKKLGTYIIDLTKSNENLQTAYIELKKNKLTIEKLQQQAAFANLTKGIAHEIRNPFAILQSSMELLIDRRNNESEAQELVERIKVGIKRILKIIQVMLKYGGAAAKEKETLDVNAFLEDFLSMAVRKYEREGITFEVDLGVLPPLFGDPTALYQIIGNLVQNAQEAITEAKREAGLIHIKTEPKSRLFEDLSIEGVELSVCDNGIGISDDVRLQIYDAFFSTKYGNQGLGLSVVLNLIKDHNGLIDVESKAGHGTTFRVWLPLDSQCLVN